MVNSVNLPRAGLVFTGALVLSLLPQFGHCGEPSTFIDLTVANTGFSFSDDAAWGWWNPSKYDRWEASEEEDFGLAEGRLEVSGNTYIFVLGFELYPTIEAVGESVDPGGGNSTYQQISSDIEVFDLGFGQKFGSSRSFYVTPWLGLTHFRIDEKRALAEVPEDSVEDTAKSRLWGIAVGAEAGLPVSQSWTVTGRLVARWARGDRDTVIHLTGPPDALQTADVDLSDNVSRGMWGIDLGAQWTSSDSFHLEGGWRYRDWQYSDGPGSFSGPYVRCSIGF
jgi:hypothetical protein